MNGEGVVEGGCGTGEGGEDPSKLMVEKLGISLCQKKKIWISAFLFGGIVYFVNIRHYANFQIYRPINDTGHPT